MLAPCLSVDKTRMLIECGPTLHYAMWSGEWPHHLPRTHCTTDPIHVLPADSPPSAIICILATNELKLSLQIFRLSAWNLIWLSARLPVTIQLDCTCNYLILMCHFITPLPITHALP